MAKTPQGYRYNSEEVAQYLSLYAKMQEAARELEVFKGAFNSSSEGGKENFKSPLKYCASMLRVAVAEYNSQVPQVIREKIAVGQTAGQLESLATNTLLELKD
jgi:hypothetical protein